MMWFRRILLFGLVNIAIILMVSIVTQVLGLEPYMNGYGIDYTSLMVFCAIWGMAGSFISLMLSKQMAKWTMGVQLVPQDTRDPTLQQLVQTVNRLSMSAGLPKMPEIGIYDSPEVNAFATGPSKSNSLVAVSSGLLHQMNRDEVEGVLGHEVAHIANGDMVTMTLVQGVVNAFVMFFARIAAFAVSQFMRGNDDEGPGFFVQFALIMVFQIFFGFLGMFVVAGFSRFREYRADAGSARIGGREKMIRALEALRRTTDRVDSGHKEMAAMKISNPKGLLAFLSTHPPLEDRIDRLRKAVA